MPELSAKVKRLIPNTGSLTDEETGQLAGAILAQTSITRDSVFALADQMAEGDAAELSSQLSAFCEDRGI